MRHNISVAVFDPKDPATFNSVAEALKEYQSVVTPFASEAALRAAITRRQVDVAVLSLEKPFKEAFSLLREIQSKAPQAAVIFVARFDDEMLWAWMEVIQRGAYEFLPKPFDSEELKYQLLRAVEKHHPAQLRKCPPAESLKSSNGRSTRRTATAGA
jgi:DNA-binding NtrC family response regulator